MDFQSEIMLAFQARILHKIPLANNMNCWIDDAPLPLGKDPPPHENSFSICPGDGRYDPDWGGAICALKEHTTVSITHMAKIQIDDAKKLTHAIAASERSMLKIKRQLLATFLNDAPASNPTAKQPWRPKSVSGKFFWDSLRPVSYVSPKRHQDWPLLYQILEFQFAFFWDL